MGGFRAFCRLSWITAAAGLAIFAGSGLAGSARAETTEVRVAYQYGLTYLPLIVMKNQKLVEKHAAAAGIKDLTAKWSVFSNGAAMNDALLSGNVDFIATGTPPAITIWAKTKGNPRLEVKGVAAFSTMPIYLISINPKVKTLKDFTDEDRIALPAVKVSVQAVTLQMAAAKIFGEENFDKLDHLTVSMSHPDAMTTLLSEHPQVNATFSNTPYMQRLLESPKAHKVFSSFDDVLGGPATNGVVMSTAAFREENPKAYGAFLAALRESMNFINEDKTRAVKIYVEESGDKLPLDFLVRSISAPDMQFTVVPRNTMAYADFMNKRGLIKVRAETWKDIFFPEIHNSPGS